MPEVDSSVTQKTERSKIEKKTDYQIKKGKARKKESDPSYLLSTRGVRNTFVECRL